MAQHHERRQWYRQWVCGLLGRRQHGYVSARGPPDDRRSDVHVYSGRRGVQLYVIAHHAECCQRSDDGKCGGDGRERLHLDRDKFRRLADGHERWEWFRQRHGELQRGGQQLDIDALGDADGGHGDIQRDAGRRVRLLALSGHANGRHGGNDGKRGRDGRQRLRLVCVELGRLAHGHERRKRERKRHNQLQRCRQHRVCCALGLADGGLSDVHRDPERLVRLHRDPHESKLQPHGRYLQRRRDGWQRMLVDRHAIGIVDHDYQRLERDGERYGPLHRLVKQWIVVSDGNSDGGWTAGHHHAAVRHDDDSQCPGWPADRHCALTMCAVRVPCPR